MFKDIDNEKFIFRLHADLPPLATNRSHTVPKNFTSKLNTPCNYSMYQIEIDWNGDLILCPHQFWSKNFKIGNVNNDCLKTLWYGKKYSNIRKGLLFNRKNGICDNCDAFGNLYGDEYASHFKKIL